MAVVDHLPIVKNLVCADEEATATLAQALARAPGITQAFIALHGDLGAGKTTLVRHLLRALGVQGRIKSPTYAVVEPHVATQADGSVLPIYHFDFYRFSDPREWEDAGFRDLFAGPGLKLAEWPAQAGACLPVADLEVTLQVQDEQRRVGLCALTPRGAALLQGLAP